MAHDYCLHYRLATCGDCQVTRRGYIIERVAVAAFFPKQRLKREEFRDWLRYDFGR